MTPLTKEQAIVVSAYTGVLACEFPDLHEAIEERLGRPVFTHELGSGPVWDEIKAAFRDDFMALAPKDR
jgi:hypothetical protein